MVHCWALHKFWKSLISIVVISTTVVTTEVLCISQQKTIKSTKLSPSFKPPNDYHFSIPISLDTEETQIKNENNKLIEKFWELWNDKRSITSLIRDNTIENNNGSDGDCAISPYCIKSQKLNIEDNPFQIIVYPRGIFSSSTTSKSTSASAYLSYIPNQYNDEIDIYWRIKLLNTATNTTLPIFTSGGLPRSNDTFISAMTFCSKNEAVDSVGRTNDWGSSVWNSNDVYNALMCDSLMAIVDIWVYDIRVSNKGIFNLPGSINTVISRANDFGINRTFRAGEVVVPLPSKNKTCAQALEKLGIYSGVDYRIMTIADENNNPVFQTNNGQENVKLALRPTGWKLQQSLWKTRGFSDWPVEIDTSLLKENECMVASRYNLQTTIPRFRTTLLQETKSLLLALLIAISPILITSIGREYVSLYAIPSASMEPTLQKGDVLLVEKLPNIYNRIQRGNIVLFNPPPTLESIIQGSNGQKKKQIFGKNSLFVKRVVGMPGDEDILMDENTNEMTINSLPAIGPNRNLCDDEPLKLISKLLKEPYGKGTSVPRLNDNEYFVLGDCKDVSVDSRVFGVLEKQYFVGKPVGRIWPLSRFTFSQL